MTQIGLTTHSEDYPKKLSDWKHEDWIMAIIDMHDQNRIDNDGGYPSSWVIENGKVYWATIDHDGAPELEMMLIQEFIDDNDWLVEEIFQLYEDWREK